MGETALNSKLTPEEAQRLDSVLARVIDARDGLLAKHLWNAVAIARAHHRIDAIDPLLAALEARGGETMKLIDEMARLAFIRGELDTALSMLEERYRRSPSPSARIAIARFHLETGNANEAKRISDEVAMSDPSLLSGQQLAADVARATGRYEAARSYFLNLVDQRSEDPYALVALAKLALDERDEASATAFFRRAVTSVGETASTAVATQLAEVADALKQPDLAMRFRDEAARQISMKLARGLNELEDALRTSKPVRVLSPDRPRGYGLKPARAEAPRRTHEAEVHSATNAAVPDDPRVLEVLKNEFGHERLRDGQAAVIARVLAGHDTLAIMPTGAGKSLTFQLPAMLDEQTTVVISPLIALMKDQVDSLPASVRAKTALINSSLSADEMRERLDQLSRHELKLLYVAPERLRNYAFVRTLRDAGVSRVVIDEAHCISMWGHDFRPDYLSIPRAVSELGDPPILAITATATPDMVDQIATGLDRKLDVVRTSVFRPNLRYEVHHLAGKEAKLERVIEICRQERGPGIIYVSSRRDTESIAALLRDRNIDAVPYHAGLDQSIRTANQDRFMTGKARVVVATIAFGMGVNKADVRFIVHLVAPRSLEAYSQESGRAGRDGAPARCVLLVSNYDRTQLMMNARRDELDLPALRRVYAQLMRQARGTWVIADHLSLRSPSVDQDGEADPRIALGVLEQAGFIHRHPDAPFGYDLRWLPSEETRIDQAMAQEWSKLERCLPEEWGRRGCSIQTAEMSRQSGLTPAEIDRVLQAHPALSIREGQRGMCFSLNQISGDATGTLQSILDRSREEAEERIRLVMDYANGQRCRHAALAAHLGETLEACGTACDICRKSADRPHAVRGAVSRSAVTAETAFIVLDAVRTIPFAVGKTGLTRLLLGSVESRIRADRSTSFGRLSNLTRGRIETLIESLIEQGFLARDDQSEYRLISLTRKGASAKVSDLEIVADPRELDAHDATDQSLYSRLTEWRRSKAIEEAVPAYVVAPNSMLKNLAASRPRTKTALLSVPGIGSTRVEKYGTELLSVISEPHDD